MEQCSKLSAEQSLKLIDETIRDNRLVIAKKSGSHFILWGALLSLVALAVYFFWRGERQSGLEFTVVRLAGNRISARRGYGKGCRAHSVKFNQ